MGVDKKETRKKKLLVMDCVRIQMCHGGVRLLELVLWHSTLPDMVGRPLSRVLCVIIGGVIIWAQASIG